ncbi:MAG: HAD family hydrolase [Hyphococcus sp.]
MGLVISFAFGLVFLTLSFYLGNDQTSLLSRTFEIFGTALLGYFSIRLIIRLYEAMHSNTRERFLLWLMSGTVRIIDEGKDKPWLIAADIEGCITPPDRTQVDVTKFAKLRRYCEFTKQNINLPQVIFFTGRSQGYVELLAQSLGLLNTPYDLPFVIENGAALYFPTAKRTTQIISEDQMSNILKIRQILGEQCCDNEFEPKSYMVTLNPRKNQTVDELRDEVTLTLRELDLIEHVTITSTASSVDISPKGISKLNGLKEALKFASRDGVPVPLDKVLAFGDQIADLEVLKSVGIAYCPAHYSHAEVREFIKEKHGDEFIVEKQDIEFVIQGIERECSVKIV